MELRPPIGFIPAGHFYNRVDLVRSELIRKKLKPQPKDCFRNALHAIKLVGEPVRYVEGWVVLRVVPIVACHGWLETEDGDIIECTTDAYTAYYPVRRWKRPWPAVALKATVPLLEFDFPHGKDGRKLMEVYNEAMRNETGLDMTKLKELAHCV